MALAIDSSSPLPVSGTTLATAGSITTASFTPPVGSILLCLFGNGSTSGANFQASSVTDNLGTHLTYTQQCSSVESGGGGPCNCSIYTSSAILSSHAMTVTCNLSGSTDALAGMIWGVIVFTGAATTQAGNNATGKNTTGSPTATLASAASTSWIMGVFASGNSYIAGPATGSGQTCTFNGNSYVGDPTHQTGDNAWGQGNSAVGNSNLTINDTNNLGDWTVCAYEVQAAAGGGATALPLRTQPWPQAMFRSAYR